MYSVAQEATPTTTQAVLGDALRNSRKSKDISTSLKDEVQKNTESWLGLLKNELIDTTRNRHMINDQRDPLSQHMNLIDAALALALTAITTAIATTTAAAAKEVTTETNEATEEAETEVNTPPSGRSVSGSPAARDSKPVTTNVATT